MRSNYKRLGDYIERCDEFNEGMQVEELQGISNNKYFQRSHTNTIGIDLTGYRVVRNNQFAFNRATTRNGDRISIALRNGTDCMVSPSYRIFKSKDENVLLSEYLMMWFRRPEFDRYARFKSHGSAHEFFDYEEMCEVELPIPSIEKQREIVKEYNTIVNRIQLNEQLNQKLEETAHCTFKQMFFDTQSIDVDSVPLSKYADFNPNHSIKDGEIVSYVEMADLQENLLSIKGSVKRGFTSGSKFKNNDTLLARITPCLENGKTAFVDCLLFDEVAFGSTEFIVLRAKKNISPFWIYCLSRSKLFRAYAISSMTGTSGRQRVHSDYLEIFQVPTISEINMKKFHALVSPMFDEIKNRSNENKFLENLKNLVLSKLATVEMQNEYA